MATTLILAIAALAGVQGPEGLTYFCAAPLAHHSTVRIPSPREQYRVSGRLSPTSLEEIPDPSKPLRVVGNDIPNVYRGAHVTIVDEEANADVQVSLAMVPRYESAGDGYSIVTDVSVATDIDGIHRDYPLLVQTHRDYRDSVPFEIEVVGDLVRIAAGGKTVQVKVPFGAEAIIELSCIGGVFDFEGIEIVKGRRPGPDGETP